MKAEYDFSKGKRGALLPTKGKTRITIYIDDAVLGEFRARAEKAGTGYQTIINEVLKAHLAGKANAPVTEAVLRKVIREAFAEDSRPTPPTSGRGDKRRAA